MIIVTGGAGFIGSNFIKLLVKKTSEQIVVVDNLTYASTLGFKDIVNLPILFYQYNIIDNDILESIHIDFEKSHYVGVEGINGANIKCITIACARNISNIFLNIRENCPKLQKIRLMYTDVSSDVIQKNPDINIIYLKQI